MLTPLRPIHAVVGIKHEDNEGRHLDGIVGPSPHPINSVDYLDWGVARAFGMVGGFRVKSIGGEDVTEQFRFSYRDGPGAFDAILAEAELGLNRSVIDGPSADEEPELRALGWDPRVRPALLRSFRRDDAALLASRPRS